MKMKLQSTTVQSTAMLFLLAMMTSLLAAEPVKTKGKATQQKVAKEKTTKGKSTTKGKGVKVKAANKIVLPANFESIKKSTFQGVRLSSQQRREVDTLTKNYSSRLSAAAQVRGKTSTDAKLRQEFRTALRKILTAAQKKQQQAKNSPKTKSLAAKKQQPAAKQNSKTTEISQKVPTKVTKKQQPTAKTTKKTVANKKQPANKKDTAKTAKASSKSGTRTTKTAKKKPPQDD